MFKVSPEDDARFERELPDSMRAVRAVANHLRSFGTAVEIICDETYVDRWTYEDRSGDLLANGRVTIEVKHRRELTFTCQDEFPYPSLIVDRANKKSGHCNLYVSVNCNLTAAAFVSLRSRPYWTLDKIEDRKRGYPAVPVFFCPKEYARFVILRS